MHFNPGAFVILVAFGALVVLATTSNGGNWFHAGEAAATLGIAAGLAGLLAPGRWRAR